MNNPPKFILKRKPKQAVITFEIKHPFQKLFGDRKIIDNMVEQNGVYKKQEIWVLDTVGTNLLDVLGLDFMDNKRTMSNDIIEIYEVLGIEAARQMLIYELSTTFNTGGGVSINYNHLSVLVDQMCHLGEIISMDRHGLSKIDIDPIARASF